MMHGSDLVLTMRILSGSQEKVTEPKHRADEEEDHHEEDDHRSQPLCAAEYAKPLFHIIH